jgi:predicted RNA methylase
MYYDQRFLPYVGLDTSVGILLKIFGKDFFTNKSVLCLDCGAGLMAFQLAALFKVKRVIGTERDINKLLENCAQLRKFKHDGVDVWDENSETSNYPKLLVRRTGPVRVTNKPWHLGDRELNDDFPFNIEFQYLSECEAWTEKADIVIAHNHDRPLTDSVHADGFVVYKGRQISPDVCTSGFAKRYASRSLHVYQRIG